MTATFLACIVLTDSTGISGIIVSFIVSLILAFGIVVSALGISWASARGGGWKIRPVWEVR